MKKILGLAAIGALATFGTAVATVAVGTDAQAEDSIYLLAGGVSTHFSDRPGNKDYNDNHKNIGVEYETDFTWLEEQFEENEFLRGDYYLSGVVVHMDNSVDNDSTLVAASWKRKWALDKAKDFSVAIGGTAGFQNGYPSKSEGRKVEDMVPVAFPLAEISYKRVTAYGTCVPEVYASGFCFAGLKFKLFSF